jgi:hypothetical protein
MELSASQQRDPKKKRKNKKKKKGPKAKFSSDLDNEENDVEDEITRTVKLVDKMFGTTSYQQENQRPEVGKSEQIHSVLHIQHKHLNPQTEIKRMFGKVVNQEQQKKRRAGSNRPLRQVIMTNPKENWPPITRTGLSMNLAPAPEGETLSGNEKNKNLLYFAFDHSQR